ncbi:MAG: 3-oxoacyl-ACP synthase, partial [Prevotella sp.]
MTHCIAHNISSPLGWTSEENFAAVLQGRTQLTTHEGKWGLPQSFVASLFDDNAVEERFKSHVGDVGLTLSRFEMLVVLSVKQAAEQVKIDLGSRDVGIVIATTKGNVELLSPTNQPHIP